MKQPQYHLTMSDASIRNFCTYQCVMSFQNRYNKRPLTLENDSAPANTPVPTGLPKRVKKSKSLRNLLQNFKVLRFLILMGIN